ncbi:MAG TPA: (2Fe-2S)-binding protein, partial [Oxalicibacterium sp.]|nr:(2Fe-2S)-binding protein [Oxalicibacterium sp.]
SCTLFGRDRVGVLFRIADDYAADKKLVDEIESRFGIVGPQVLRYDDHKRGNGRHMLIGDGKLQAVSLSGDLSAEHWLKQYLEGEQSVAKLGRLLLMPSANPPQDFKSRGRIVCNCLNVSETEIADALRGPVEGDALAMLQQKLKCGTSCGSCVPELKKLILSRQPQQAAA